MPGSRAAAGHPAYEMTKSPRFPQTGLSADAVAEALRAHAGLDSASVETIGFARRFFAGSDVAAVAADAAGLFAHAGRVSSYPGLPQPPGMGQIQRELQQWALELLDAPEGTAARLTSGGTESVILALRACLKTASPGKPSPAGTPPEIVAAWSAHPCIDKAAELLGARLVRVPVGVGHVADPVAMAAAITPATRMLYVSFPSYAYGLADDVAAFADLALEHGLWLHVDACMSGFLAPFQRMNGEAIPFCGPGIPGVSSLSADFHKHGYSAKGASALLLAEEAARAIDFVYSDHPLPTMATETLAGTAPGAALASAWAVMRYLGAEGYCKLAARLSAARQAFAAAVRSVPGFSVLGEPLFSLMVVTSSRHDMAAVHRGMAARGWFTLAVASPPGLHLNIGALDAPLAERFAADLSEVVRDAA